MSAQPHDIGSRVTALETLTQFQYPTILTNLNLIHADLKEIRKDMQSVCLLAGKNSNGLAALKEDVDEHKKTSDKLITDLRSDGRIQLTKWGIVVSGAASIAAAAMMYYR